MTKQDIFGIAVLLIIQILISSRFIVELIKGQIDKSLYMKKHPKLLMAIPIIGFLFLDCMDFIQHFIGFKERPLHIGGQLNFAIKYLNITTVFYLACIAAFIIAILIINRSYKTYIMSEIQNSTGNKEIRIKRIVNKDNTDYAFACVLCHYNKEKVAIYYTKDTDRVPTVEWLDDNTVKIDDKPFNVKMTVVDKLLHWWNSTD